MHFHTKRKERYHDMKPRFTVLLLLVSAIAAFGAEKILMRNLTPKQKVAAFQDARKNCVLITQNDGSTRMVRHNHSEECGEPAEDGSRLCLIDGASMRTNPVTEESYVTHLKSGGTVPAMLLMKVEHVCEACEGKGKFVTKNEKTGYSPLRVSGTGNLIGGKTVTHKGMDTITFCKECGGKGKMTVTETREVEISVQ